MIKITQETYTNPLFCGDLSNYLLDLYIQFSVNPLPDVVTIPNDQWKPFISLLYQCNKQEPPFFIIDLSIIDDSKYRDYVIDENKVMLALSGGKDSVANLVRLLDEKKEVTCYFMKKANLSYQLEEGKAQQVADLYNVPLLIDNLGRSGKTDYHDNPVKNQLIMARMLEYGLKQGYGIVSLGEFYDDVETDNLDIQHNMTDAKEFNELFEKAIQSHIPEFKYDYFWQAEATGMSYIILKHPEVIPLLQSCLMPTRYVRQQLKYVEQFHLHADIKDPNSEGIMEGRCMACWKCMAEWLYLVIWKKLPYNKEYMEQKVIPTLLKHRNELDSTLTDKNPSEITMDELLDALIDIEYLKNYVKDPSLIYADIHHYHEELDRND